MFIPASIKKVFKQREIARFYRRFVKKGDLCFDIGANRGERTDCLVRIGARVIALEPQNSCYTILQNKYKAHPEVTVMRYALGSKEEEAELLICNETNECSTLSKEFVSVYARISHLNWGRTEKIKVTTLDKLCQEFGTPAFCKVDVEGYEFEVFSGLSRPIRFICFEFNYPLLSDTVKSLERLSLLGNYQCNYLKYETMELALTDWLPVKTFTARIRQIISPEVLTGEIVLECLDL